MKKIYWIVLLMLVGALSSCGPKGFMIYSDDDYARLVEKEFERRKELAQNRADWLFGVMDDGLTMNEEQGLKFLYAFMPLNDLADYDGEFFLKQVRSSLAARDTFHWGATIPESEFRHFVLPYRINNENLDTSRQVFFEELKDRIKDLSMLDAALEVNHWCHEKVSYKGTDIRTSSPLATVKTAYGRCGEESTFTTAALRSVAIPARQVYTPRWAHSDDNHAWVEFWADGEWHYLGACEPGPVPDNGWFTEPARRAMLIHTKAFGAYQGDGRVGNREAQFSLLNTLEVYAQTKELFVKVVDKNNQVVDQADVEFQLYNYAEFYPISTKKTDENGFCSFLTGFGDLQVWAHNGDLFNYDKIAVAEVDTLILVLNQNPYTAKTDVYDLIPPIQRDPFVVSQEGKDLNSKRLKEEDAIRGAYEATFMSEERALEIAEEYELKGEDFVRLVKSSRGNYDEIAGFINKSPSQLRPLAMSLLDQVSLKDLRDTKKEILRDHLLGANAFINTDTYSNDIFKRYILNPRVATEMLLGYRDILRGEFTNEEVTALIMNPTGIIAWIKKNIQLDESENYYETPITPAGVYRLRIADELSIKIFTVAMLRTFGHPARLEPGTEYAQYMINGEWKSVHFSSVAEQSNDRGLFILKNNPANVLAPKYHIHFTIAQFKDGKYHTLHYDWDKPLSDFADGVELDEGYYMLVTGNRQPGGAVLHSQEFFELKKGQIITKVVSLRTNDQVKEVIATIDLNTNYQALDGKDISLQMTSDQEWQVIAWIDPDKEPTKHTFQDLPLLKKELEAINIPFTFVIPKDKLTDSFKNSEYIGLPKNHQFLVTNDLTLVESIEDQTKKKLISQLPVFVIANSKGEVIYLSSGYKIGIGEEIVKVVR
ncbi:MAG: transglutaminase domain-containing protein [Bacteroidales bacterium]|nr:transglutaminase domain-containing protein [Bacteroidales bacterium]